MEYIKFIDKNICQTYRPGKHCLHWESTKNFKGCTFIGGRCYPVIVQCSGCSHVLDESGVLYCEKYASPEISWSGRQCNMATHIEKETKESKFVDPLKASKRAAKGK